MPACGELGRLLVTHASSEKDVNRGMVLLETSCAEGDAAACLSLAGTYRDHGDAKGRARARELLARACDLKSARGCMELGVLSETRDRHDAGAVLEAYRRSCELGDAKGCAYWGYALRRQAPGDPQAADDAFIRACSLGNLSSCNDLGRSRIYDPATRADGVAYLLRACEGGFAPGCVATAELFAPVVGAAASWFRALPVADRACADRNDDSCAIADACRIASNRDALAAIRRLRVGCDHGLALACFYWANIASESPDADPDSLKRAYGFACSSTSLAQSLACTRVAALRLATATTAEEAERSTQSLERQCERSVGEACCNVAEIYQSVPWSAADALTASGMRERACNLGVQRCCRP